jgi:hypothetical protein
MKKKFGDIAILTGDITNMGRAAKNPSMWLGAGFPGMPFQNHKMIRIFERF